MKNVIRVLLGLLMMLATLLLVSCSGGSPGCQGVTFGSATCSAGSGGTGFGGGGSGGGGGGGGGGNATPTALVYDVDGTEQSGSTNGTIAGWDLSNSAGSFLALSSYTAPQVPASETGEGMVVVNKQFVYTIFELQEQIYGWSINSTNGGLTALSGFPITVTLNLPVNAPGQFQMTTDPGGNYLFISSTGANDIFVFSINSSTGALTPVLGSPFASPIEPGNITTDGLGRFLYVCGAGTHEGTDFVGFTIGTGGLLTLIPGGPFGAGNIWQLQGDASGRYLIGTSGSSLAVSGFDDDHLYVYSINQTTGAVTQAAGSPVSTVYSPYTIAIQPASSNGEFVYSFGINDAGNGYNPIEGYQLNTSTGALTAITGSPFGNNVFLGDWGQFDQSGSNLLVYSSILSGGSTVTQIGPMQVGSDGSLTDPVAPITLGAPGYWVVTDP
jgi:6-phosphogluconolactonase (cycloisomerase 2 family)